MTGRTIHLTALVAAATLLACLAALSAGSREAGAAFPGENGGIVFNVFRTFDDPSSLYSRDTDTGETTQLTNNADKFDPLIQDVNPAVSPDGSRVVFVRTADFSPDGLYVANTDGTGVPARLTDDPAMAEVEPTWSPDGRKVGFVAYPTDEYGNREGSSEVYVVDADGSDRTKITDNELDERSFAWSPDGTRIAFSAGGGVEGGVYLMDADGSDALRVGDGYFPSWSPDGGKLAYAAGGGIYTADADGSGQQRIVNDHFEDDPGIESVQDRTPVWSPDGARIAFGRSVVFEEATGHGIYTMNPDGSGLERVAGPFPRSSDPDWGPTPGTRPSPDGPPETTIFSGPSGLTGPSASFDFVSSRPGASFECSLEGAGFSPCEGPKRYEALPNGGHAFEVRATDAAAGADPTPARLAWEVDARAPEGGAAVDGGRARTRDRSAELALEAADPGSGVSDMRLRNRGGEWKAWRPYAPTAEWTLRGGEGTKTVLAQYRDGVGNVSEVARDSIFYRR